MITVLYRRPIRMLGLAIKNLSLSKFGWGRRKMSLICIILLKISQFGFPINIPCYNFSNNTAGCVYSHTRSTAPFIGACTLRRDVV